MARLDIPCQHQDEEDTEVQLGAAGVAVAAERRGVGQRGEGGMKGEVQGSRDSRVAGAWAGQ